MGLLWHGLFILFGLGLAILKMAGVQGACQFHTVDHHGECILLLFYLCQHLSYPQVPYLLFGGARENIACCNARNADLSWCNQRLLQYNPRVWEDLFNATEQSDPFV